MIFIAVNTLSVFQGTITTKMLPVSSIFTITLFSLKTLTVILSPPNCLLKPDIGNRIDTVMAKYISHERLYSFSNCGKTSLSTIVPLSSIMNIASKSGIFSIKNFIVDFVPLSEFILMILHLDWSLYF